MMNISVEDLEIVLALSAEKSISQAAIKLGYTQQALSYRLKKTEKQLNKKIFSRTAQGLVLLPQAGPVLKDIENILSTLRSIQREFEGFSPDGQSRSIPLYMSTALETIDVLSQTFAAVFSLYPDISWCVSPQYNEKRLSDHLKDNIHAMALSCSPLSQQGFLSHCFFEAPVILVASPAWRDREPILIEIDERSPYSLNQIISDQEQRALYALKKQYVAKEISVDNHRVAQELALSGQGGLLTHGLTVQKHLEKGDLVILKTFSEHVCRGYLSVHESYWNANNPYTFLWETLQKKVQEMGVNISSG